MYDVIVSTNNATSKQIAANKEHVLLFVEHCFNEPDPGRIVIIVEEVNNVKGI